MDDQLPRLGYRGRYSSPLCMLPLTSDRWQELHHAYGPGDRVPIWLRELASGDRAKAMEEISSNLFHQQTVYPATIAAIPHMVSIAEELSGKWRLEIVTFVGLVAAECYRFVLPLDIQLAFEASLNVAAELADDLFGSVEMDRSTAKALLSATAALYGSAALARTIFTIGEFHTQCPQCRTTLYVRSNEDGMIVASDYLFGSRDAEVTHVSKGSVDSGIGVFPETGQENSMTWLSDLAARANDHETAALLPYLYGSATCPSCRNEFNLIKHLASEE